MIAKRNKNIIKMAFNKEMRIKIEKYEYREINEIKNYNYRMKKRLTKEKLYKYGAKKMIYETNNKNIVCVEGLNSKEISNYVNINEFVSKYKNKLDLKLRITNIYVDSEDFYYMDKVNYDKHFKLFPDTLNINELKGCETSKEYRYKYLQVLAEFMFIMDKLNILCDEFEILSNNNNYYFIDFDRCYQSHSLSTNNINFSSSISNLEKDIFINKYNLLSSIYQYI